MPQDIRIWEVLAKDHLREIERSKLDLESRIEKWLEQDISIVSDDLLVIGRQVPTSYGGYIDLLCLDRQGDLVILELKRDKTPRDIVAQTLDYASWVQNLSHERITQLANDYLGKNGPLEDAFQKELDADPPETLNGQPRMLIVASRIDSSTERIINYLSENYGVDINAVSFQYFGREGKEYLARVFLIDPEQVTESSIGTRIGKRRPNRTPEQLQSIVSEKDESLGELYRELAQAFRQRFDARQPTVSTLSFIGKTDRSWTMFHLVPGESEKEAGVRYRAYVDRIAKYLGLDREAITSLLPPNWEEIPSWKGGPYSLGGYFCAPEDTAKLLDALSNRKSRQT